MSQVVSQVAGETSVLEEESLWYKDSIIYQLHVRAFYDSDGNGIGDFRGLTEKLDYLHDLGITAIWLLPFYPSPLKDDGYDIADYTGVNPVYGNLHDFRAFVREAHRRGLKVITELVCNHTSDQHPWFQRARRAKPGSLWRDFYVWSNTANKYNDARIIFKDFEVSNWSWDPLAGAYYWHRFYSHQPDLNYDNPYVQKAVMRSMDFWLRLGVDGLRLDAIPYIYEREGTNCENLPETHAFLKELRSHIERKFPNRMLLAEANQWPEDAVAYFGDGDECHTAFHFPLMPRLFMSIYMEDRLPIVDILEQTPRIPENCQWALFLRNHDELTLEMVTDEERDYMYRVYAKEPEARINLGIRRRLAPLLRNHGRRFELMNGLLFSLPGTPVIYYGDEIGMGDNIYLGDRNGVRTPMQWSPDRNAGFSAANSQKLFLPVIVDPEYHYETVNVQAQQSNPHSLLWWMKRLIALRKRYKAFSRGNLEFLEADNNKILAFVRRYQDEKVLVVANLSRFVQCVNLNLSMFKSMVPVEMFGRTEFPPIGDAPYFVTLGPHSFYWFSLEPHMAPKNELSLVGCNSRIPSLLVSRTWEELLRGRGKSVLADILPSYLQTQPWFNGKTRNVKLVQVAEAIRIPLGKVPAYLAFIQVDYTDGDPETYLLPLTYATREQASVLLANRPDMVIVCVQTADGEEGVLFDALAEREFGKALFEIAVGRQRLKGAEAKSPAPPTLKYRPIFDTASIPLEPSLIEGHRNNSLLAYGNLFVLKLYRRLEPGINPDIEIGRFLAGKGFTYTPALASVLELRQGRSGPMTAAIVQRFVPNEGDAWRYAANSLNRYLEQSLTSEIWVEDGPSSTRSLLDLAQNAPHPLAFELIGDFLETARLLGHRTAQMHLALASDTASADFAPEPFTGLYQRSIYQSMRVLTGRVFRTLSKKAASLPEPGQSHALMALALEPKILSRFQAVLDHKITAMRIRCHGHYHLGQVLCTEKDFFIIDFEGEPTQPLSQRRIKRSPLRDVAGMLRSFHYAAQAAVLGQVPDTTLFTENSSLQSSARFWRQWVSATFLNAYLSAAREADFLPKSREELEVLLDVFLLEKAIYELQHELSSRPTWVQIPLQGILELVEGAK